METYQPLTLGTSRSRSLKPESLDAKPQGTIRPSYKTWREGLARHEEETEYEEHPDERVLESLRRAPHGQGRRLWLILGEPGSGKSTLLEAWLRRWARELSAAHLGLQVPVLVRLRELNPDDVAGEPEDVAAQLWRYGLRSKALLADLVEEAYQTVEKIYQRERGPMFRLVWLLDGLDELDVRLRDAGLYEQLVNLPGMKAITCRTAVYESLRQQVDRYKEREYKILPLKPPAQLEFLKRIFGGDQKRASDMHRMVSQSVAIRPLAGNPLMLGMIARVSVPMESTATRAAFYEKAVQEMWNEKLLNSSAQGLIEERDKTLTQLASQMELEKIEYDLRQLIGTTVAVAHNQAVTLRQALEQTRLVRVDQRRERFSFLHLTFQEFYLARALEPQRLQQVLEQHWDDPRYEETLALLISRLLEKGRAEEIDQGICWLIRWGEQTHHKSPRVLWEERRTSPLRVALHLLQRAGIPLVQLPELETLLGQNLYRSQFRKAAVAVDTSTPLEILALLANDLDEYVRRAAAGNPSMPPEQLALLANDPGEYVRIRAAGNPSMPPEQLALLANDPVGNVRRAAAGNPSTPPEQLALLANEPLEYVRSLVARNPSTPPEQLALLTNDPVIYVRMYAARNPSMPPEQLALLANEPEVDVRREAAGNPFMPPEQLALLANDPVEYVRKKAALNPSMPPGQLALLANDPVEGVRMWAAGNPSMPPEQLALLANDPVGHVRRAAAGDLSRTPEQYALLANDPVEFTRRMFADDPSMPPEQLALLANDPAESVRTAAAFNPSMPPEQLTLLANDPAESVRTAAASHPSMPPEQLALLANDPGKDVRWAALRNPSLILEDLFPQGLFSRFRKYLAKSRST